ncbi:MAG: molybdopterin-dependent oxidoreductase [Gammaproteobacteria bacterium]|nr:molybdopterin-dependent oxidoreductase [Gammaproteobacteria bacterium]
MQPTQPHATTNPHNGESFVFDGQPLLAATRVRYAGEAVALVIADTREQAMDTAEAVIGAGGGVPTVQFCTCPDTVYEIGQFHLRIQALLINTVPIGVTRGPGFAEAVDIMERLIDKAARELNIDRFELRRRNLIKTARMPWRNGAVYATS